MAKPPERSGKMASMGYAGEDKYSKWLRETYPKTEDAQLVDWWFGSYLHIEFHRFLIRGREKELLKRARELERERQEKEKK